LRGARFFVTLDTDFSDVRKFTPGSHPGILLVRTTHASVSAVSLILRRVLDEARTRVRSP
jgi:predicted nuclease of predicted toxin-antitoxin system